MCVARLTSAVSKAGLAAQAWESVLAVGHSYGGPLVLRLASEHPKRIAGVVGLGIGYPTGKEAASSCGWIRCTCEPVLREACRARACALHLTSERPKRVAGVVGLGIGHPTGKQAASSCGWTR